MKSFRSFTVLACLLCLLLRALGAPLMFHPDPADHFWNVGYETTRIAMHLADHGEFLLEGGSFGHPEPLPSSWIAPLYPGLVAALFCLFGTFSAASLWTCIGVQIAFAVGTTQQLASCARGETTRVWTFRLAALGYALSPLAIRNCTSLIWSTTAETFVLAALLRLCLADIVANWRRSCGEGLGLGLSLLLSPVLLLPWLLYLALARRRQLLHLGATLLLAALVLTPWLIRNHQVFGHFVFVKSNFGHELFVGNNPGADGGYHRIDELVLRSDPPPMQLLQPMPDEAQFANRLGSFARQWIAAHPARFVELCLRRLAMFWLLPTLGEGRPGIGVLLRVLDFAVLLLAALGATVALLGGDGRRDAIALLLLLIGYQLPYLLTHADITRYRVPALVLAYVFAARGVVAVVAGFQGRRVRDVVD